jgi:beta-galactosidase beta subunit
MLGVAEKHNFHGIQRKIPQKSDFVNNRDMNQFPHGETAADLAKMFAQFFLQKSVFTTKNTIFAKI